MIKFTYKQINNTNGLIEIAKEIAKNNPSFLNLETRNITLTEYRYLSILKNELTIAGNTKKGGIYNTIRNKIISYGVRNNLDHNEIGEFVGSDKFKTIYKKRFIYKQALIKVIKSAMKNLPEFKSYAKELSKDGKTLEYDINLKKGYLKAEKAFNDLCKFYEKKTTSVMTYLRETYHKGEFKFRYNNQENKALIEAALHMFEKKEKMNADAFDKVNNLPSLAKYWISCKYDFQSLSSSKLELFLKLLKEYVKVFHKKDLKNEEQEASRKSSMKYHKSKNPGHITEEERKQKVLEAFAIYKSFSIVAKTLENTPYNTSRQTVSNWVNQNNVKISDKKH